MEGGLSYSLYALRHGARVTRSSLNLLIPTSGVPQNNGTQEKSSCESLRYPKKNAATS